MRHSTCPVLLLFWFCAAAQSEIGAPPVNSQYSYFNNFQHSTYDRPNADSAFYYLQKLASDKEFEPSLKMLLHNSFAQGFIQNRDNENEDPAHINSKKQRDVLYQQILIKLEADTTSLLKNEAATFLFWIKIQDSQQNHARLTSLTNDFISQELAPHKLYDNYRGRYGLMIYNIISKYPECIQVADELFAKIKTSLKNDQPGLKDSSADVELEKRAWFRWMYAYACWLESTRTNDESKKEILLKTAFDFSPDLTDKNHTYAYYYDMTFLSGKENYQNDYLDFLTKSSVDKKQVLSTLLDVALVEPDYKQKLEEYYDQHNTTGKSFKTYWLSAVEERAKSSPEISLAQIDKKLFSSKILSGRWIILDFWGTWCVACRQEHPDLQAFYDSTVVQHPGKISLLTIACRDNQEKVLAYMAEKKFSFPVAMAEQNIEKKFAIQSYPTKILITPSGKYITVPINQSWQTFIKKYCDL